MLILENRELERADRTAKPVASRIFYKGLFPSCYEFKKVYYSTIYTNNFSLANDCLIRASNAIFIRILKYSSKLFDCLIQHRYSVSQILRNGTP